MYADGPHGVCSIDQDEGPGLDVLRGDSALSIRADEAEHSWRILTPVIDGWARDITPLEEYAAGTVPPR